MLDGEAAKYMAHGVDASAAEDAGGPTAAVAKLAAVKIKAMAAMVRRARKARQLH
jgi:hypothetical protein